MEPNSHMDSQTPTKRRLGRGLHALLGAGAAEPQTETTPPPANLFEIDVESIDRNPFQPRKEFDRESLAELVESIRQHGILQPLLVRPHEGHYQLIVGERRWLAAKQAGFGTVPCRVVEWEDRRVCEVAIEENQKRRDLNVLEKAEAFRDYLDRFQSSIEDLARRLSMDRSTVSNYLRLLELPAFVRQALKADKISAGHARALLPLPEAEQIALCQRIQSEALSVRATEQAVRVILEGEDGATDPTDSPGDLAELPDPPPNRREQLQALVTNHILSLQEQLRDHLGAKVEIRPTGQETGKIVIPFDSNDQFEHILRRLRGAA